MFYNLLVIFSGTIRQGPDRADPGPARRRCVATFSLLILRKIDTRVAMPAKRLIRLVAGTALLLALALAGASAASREPDVVLIRGFAGVFSTGLNAIADDLRKKGVNARVIGHLSASGLIEELVTRKGKKGRLVLVGHSFGGAAAMGMARALVDRQVPVKLVVTLDPTTSGPVVKGVGYVNYYFSGLGVGSAVKGPGKIRNIDLSNRTDHVAHFNMTTDARLKGEIVELIMRTLGR